MTRWTLLPLLALTSLIACGDKDDDDDDDDDDAVMMPQEGEWQMMDLMVVSDTCGFDDEGDTGGGEDDLVTVTVTGDDTFTVTDDDLDLACTLSGSSFSCDGGTEATDMSGDGADAILNMVTTFIGSLSSSTAGSMEGQIDVSCEGGDCDTLSEAVGIPLPCEYVMQVDISYAG